MLKINICRRCFYERRKNIDHEKVKAAFDYYVEGDFVPCDFRSKIVGRKVYAKVLVKVQNSNLVKYEQRLLDHPARYIFDPVPLECIYHLEQSL